ncbi:DUF4241 domain-containing protein [Streptomyces erythrochromogenes]|uniref:DUF4241 domain-containing protein n=1 Tax=Streptomyces erythrochromogenes TaxID=285574 RepID=UPI00380FE4A3
MVVEVGYAQAWDLEARAPRQPISAGQARERDTAGLPYAVVYRTPGREVPLGVRMVAWRAGTVDAWAYDEHGRRTAEAELRLRDDGGRLLVRRLLVRHYPDGRTGEFDVDCPRTAVDLSAGGTARISHQPEGMRGASLEAKVAVAEEHLWTARPDFGDWPAFPVADTLPDWVAARLGAPASGWRREPSRLLGSTDFDRLFRPGTRLPGGTVLDPVPCGSLRVPSGVLAVDCPQSGDEAPGITVAVPPGTYPVRAALIEVADSRYGSHEEVVAVRLQICDAPVAAWEMALGPGQDTLGLRAGEAFGFGTDGAAGAFGDAGLWQDLRDRLERANRQGSPEADKLTASLAGVHLDGGSLGADLAVFYTGGDGVHPVWVGRSPSGDVVCVDVPTAIDLNLDT